MLNRVWLLASVAVCSTFTPHLPTHSRLTNALRGQLRGGVSLHRRDAVNPQTTALPKGISPFEKGTSKSLDLQGTFRKLAAGALQLALRDGMCLLEIDFPTLLVGKSTKSQFDDFNNVQELDANRDWCVELVANTQPLLKDGTDVWLVLPDDKEVELAKQAWTGQKWRTCKYTSIRAAVLHAAGGDGSQLRLPWGTTLASTMSKVTGGDGVLGDASALDDLNDGGRGKRRRLHLVCQPGEGGPVEDWCNVETLHKLSTKNASGNDVATCIVNGALDKVRGGYYPGVFFPALAKTVPFYQQMEVIFCLKPLSDKSLYGWLYRVYPEPWQVVLQTATPQRRGDRTTMTVRDVVAMVTEQRPTYTQAVEAMVQAAAAAEL